MKKSSEQPIAWDSFFKVMRGRSYEAVVDPDGYVKELARQVNDTPQEEEKLAASQPFHERIPIDATSPDDSP